MKFGCGVALLLLCGSAFAGEISVQPPTPAGAPREVLLPQAGGWWNPAEAGSGYFMQFMTNADNSVTGFATVYTYNADGSSTFLLVQGAVSFASEAERVDTGVIARFSSPLYKAANGQPFNGSYRPAEVTPAGLGGGEFVFYTRRTGEFRAGGRSIPIRVLNSLQGEAEYVQMLSGTWRIQGRLRAPSEAPSSNPGFERAFSHVVKVEFLPMQPSWTASIWAQNLLPAASLRQFWQPPSGAGSVLTFAVTCEAECPPIPHPLGADYAKLTAVFGARIWVDVATGRAGYVTGAQPFGSDPATAYWATNEMTYANQTGGTNWVYDLFLGDTSAIGRGGVIATHSFAPQKFEANSEMVMTRIDPKTAPRGVKLY